MTKHSCLSVRAFRLFSALLLIASLTATFDPVGALQILASGGSKETLKNLLGTDKSKMIKGFDVQTQTVRDVFEMFHVGGLTWNADDILPESEVLGMTLNVMNDRTNGASRTYEIRGSLADMDYDMALRP